jgi:Flp pilus assembly pilin Flp
MKYLTRFLTDDRGQDLIEYALSSISTVFSKIQSLLANAAGT